MRRARRQQGFIFLLIPPVIAGMLILSAASLTRSLSDRQAAIRFLANQQAFYLAEGGLDMALKTLREAPPDQPLPACPPSQELSTGSASCAMTTQADGTILVTATGSVGTTATQTITAVMDRPTPLFQWALFSNGWIYLWSQPGSLVDSYDSSVGPYDPAAPKTVDATIQTNGSILQESIFQDGVPTEFWADLVVGPGGDPTVGSSRTWPCGVICLDDATVLHGQTRAASDPIALPPIIPPAGSPVGSPLTSCPNPPVLEVSAFAYSSLSMPADCHVTLVGDGIVHLEDLAIGNRSTLTLNGKIQLVTNSLQYAWTPDDPAPWTMGFPPATVEIGSGSAEVYLMGSADTWSVNFVNRTQIPKNLAIYTQSRIYLGVSGSDVSNSFYGVVYAPNSSIDFWGAYSDQTQFFGSFIGRFVDGYGRQIHYDRALKNPGNTTFSLPLKPARVRLWRQS